MIRIYKYLADLVPETDDKEEIDGFDPHHHRIIPNPTSYIDSLMHLLKGALGAGILAMPHAVKRVGLIAAPIGITAVGAVCCYCILLLIKTQYILCKRYKRGYMAYPKSMRLAINDGPPRFRRSALFFYWFVDVVLVLWQLGICTIYVIFVAETNKKVYIAINNFERRASNRQRSGCDIWILDIIFVIPMFILRPHFQAIYHDYYIVGKPKLCDYFKLWHATLRQHMGVVLLPELMISLIKDLKLLAPVSMISNFVTFCGLVLVFFYIIQDDVTLDASKFSIKDFEGVAIYIGTSLFALEAVGVVLAVEYNMEEPKRFGGICGLFSISMIVVIILYAMFGVLGYLKYGNKIKDSITLNLPNEKKAAVAQLCIGLAVFLSFPLQNFPAYKIVWYKLRKKLPRGRNFRADYAVRVLLILMPFAAAVAVPTLGPFISLIGAFCLSLLAVVFPGFMDLCLWYSEASGYGFMKYKLIRDSLLIFAGIAVLVIGCYSSILDITSAYNKVN